jgi:hypothetical protein
VKSHEIFALDVDSNRVPNAESLLNSEKLEYLPHTDRVVRPELISSFSQKVNADSLKMLEPKQGKPNKTEESHFDK